MKNDFIIISLILILFAVKAKGQTYRDSSLYLYGRVLKENSFKPISYAHIINLRNGMGTYADSTGYFSIRNQPGDSLWISALGYITKIHTLPDTIGEHADWIYLAPRVYNINEVSITYLGTYQEFKYKVANLELEKEPEIYPLFLAGVKNNYKGIKPEPSIFTPVSLLYSLFSKEGKELRKYKNETKDYEKRLTLWERYNPDVVRKLTGLKGDSLDVFMQTHSFPDSVILNSTDYELYDIIKKRYEMFENKHK